MKKFLLIWLIFISSNLEAQIAMPLLKATFIYNFAAQTEWPEAYRSGDFIIVVYGESPIAAELQKISSTKKVGTQKMVVKSCSNISTLEKCQLLFVSEGQSAKLADIITAIGTNSTLIITDGSDLCKKGAMMSFVIKSDKLGFEMSKSNMSKVNLKPTIYLEKLAIPVN